ncbi:hypothetical protein FSP39_014360 [Pinctada imbricata]|uniref:Conserved oligomeric Golgi complex subunit 8 n=1 Tax=Pinctada imbricata TaxID=66713 RepID=A0AA88XDT8_PINIB|nr:hypothetical protein FSP39_014360 [Pinctada imbricata]
MNNLTLQRHTQLLEILEMPQLMDTCVRNGYYEEALELAAHVKRLEKKHSNVPIIKTIVGEVRNSAQLMLNQLIQQLRGNVQLPACLRVIGYLRRMDVFTEVELRIKFLQARDTWFQSILDAIPTDDYYVHITKTIEASRVHLFDIITQYRAIFSDDDPLISTSKDDSVNESALFHGWVTHKISQFLTTLETDLQYEVGGRLDSILGQCMYFGLSFSRVGADFRGLLAPIFQRATVCGFQKALQEANHRFELDMRTYNLMTQTTTVGSSYTAQSGPLNPPSILLDYYPLAVYCNQVLSAFNDLRLCAPISVACDIAQSLQASLLQVNRIILAFHRAEETTFNKGEQEKFSKFCDVYSQTLLPYLNKCLQALFPPQQLAQITGLTVNELTKSGNEVTIDIQEVLKPIKHLLPQREDTTIQIQTDQSASVLQTADQSASLTLPTGSDESAVNQSESVTSTEKDGENSDAVKTESESNIEPTADEGKVKFMTGNELEEDSGIS